MRICILTTGFPTPFQPGKYTFVDQLACAWADLGNEVIIVCPIPALVELIDKKRYYKYRWERYTNKKNKVLVYCPRFFSASDKVILGVNTRRISYISFQKAVERTIKKLNMMPDVLYGHFLLSGCHAGDIGKKLGIPAFCAFGESSLWSIAGWNVEIIKKRLSKLSGIISVSTENKRVLVDNSLFRKKDIEVFPNGVDHSLFRRLNKQEVRMKLGFPENAFIGVYTGAFNDDKGVLRAQKAAIEAGSVKMIFIGGGDSKPKGSNILFCGKLHHEIIPEYLNSADFFILPTKAEGCSNAIVEAMACGLPIISANGAYNDDILSDVYSIRTEPDDIHAMINAIMVLHNDKRRREEMSIEAEKASEQFDVNKRALAIIEFMIRRM